MDHGLTDRLVVVFGGSGFIGKVLARLLCARRARVRIAVRRPGLAGELRLAGEVGQIHIVNADLTDPVSTAAALEDADAVVNLVGVLFQKGRQSFARVHTGGMENVARLAALRGIDNLLYMSALGADAGSPSEYARSKAEAEKIAREHVPTTTILRPSIVFGPEDSFFNRFAKMACYSPALPLIGGGLTRFQPLHVENLAEAVCAALENKSARGRLFTLGGPSVYSFRQLLEMTLAEIGRQRFMVPIPYSVAGSMGKTLDVLCAPTPLEPMLTADQVRLLHNDNVVGDAENTISDLVSTPLRNVEGSIGSYLWKYRPGGQYGNPSEAE